MRHSYASVSPRWPATGVEKVELAVPAKPPRLTVADPLDSGTGAQSMPAAGENNRVGGTEQWRWWNRSREQ